LPDITLHDGETSPMLDSADGFDQDNVIGFDEALHRACLEDGQVDADTVQVVLGSADATEARWGKGERLFYAILWEGVCIQIDGGVGVGDSPPPANRCRSTDWSTVIDATSGAFIVGGTASG
jgi:hypothetical protein